MLKNFAWLFGNQETVQRQRAIYQGLLLCHQKVKEKSMKKIGDNAATETGVCNL